MTYKPTDNHHSLPEYRDDAALSRKKPVLTIHRLMMVLALMFVFGFVFVLGVDYFFKLSSLQGQGTGYLCPANAGQQLAVCFKS